MANNKKTAIDTSLLSPLEKTSFDAMSEKEKSEYFGFGQGARENFDTPEYISVKEEQVYNKGNAFVVLGLDRPNNVLSGYGGSKDTHCSSVDIVAGRLGFRARRRDNNNKLLNVDPNFKLGCC